MKRIRLDNLDSLITRTELLGEDATLGRAGLNRRSVRLKSAIGGCAKFDLSESRHAVCLEIMQAHDERGLSMVLSKEEYFFQGDPDAEAAYADSHRRIGFIDGEKMLMLAVLDEAIDCYKRHLFARDRKSRNLFAESEAWIQDREHDAVFSFENVCEVLGFDADYLRVGLRRWKECQLPGPQPGKSKRRDASAPHSRHKSHRSSA